LKLKRITFFLIPFLLLITIFNSNKIKATPDVLSRIYYSLDNSSIKVGQTFNIYVNCENINDLYGASIDFKYDTSLLQILDITQGDVFTNSGKSITTLIKTSIPDASGTVSMALSLQGNIVGFKGTGKLFVIKAQSIKAGTVNIKTTTGSANLVTSGINMCVSLADSTSSGRITSVTYQDFSFDLIGKMNSLIVSNTIPTTMLPGETYNASVTIKNTGYETWSAASKYKLAPVGYSDPFHNYKLILLPNDNILPGQIKTFTFTMKAPLTQGKFTSDWQMYQEGIAWFGPSLVKQIVVQKPLRSAAIVSSTIPTTMVRGRTYSVKIVVKNTGSDIWTTSKKYKLAPVGYSDPFHNYKLVLSPSDKILPLQTKTFTFTMKAPLIKGTFTSDWRMYQEGLYWFGESLVKHIIIK